MAITGPAPTLERSPGLNRADLIGFKTGSWSAEHSDFVVLEAWPQVISTPSPESPGPGIVPLPPEPQPISCNPIMNNATIRIPIHNPLFPVCFICTFLFVIPRRGGAGTADTPGVLQPPSSPLVCLRYGGTHTSPKTLSARLGVDFYYANISTP